MIYLTLDLSGVKLHFAESHGLDFTPESICDDEDCRRILGNAEICKLQVYKEYDRSKVLDFFMTKESFFKIRNNHIENIDVICPVSGSMDDAADVSYKAMDDFSALVNSIWRYEVELDFPTIIFMRVYYVPGYLMPCNAFANLKSEKNCLDWSAYKNGDFPVAMNELLIDYSLKYNYDSCVDIAGQYEAQGCRSDLESFKNGESDKISIYFPNGNCDFQSLCVKFNLLYHALSSDFEIKKYVPPEQDIEDDDLPF